MSELQSLRTDTLQAIEAASSLTALDEVRVATLGKKGAITALMKTMGKMAPDERKAFGQEANQVKDEIAAALDQRKGVLEDAALDAQLAQEVVDVSQPARPALRGSIHPVSQVMDEAIAIFGEMGFAVAEGPEIETDKYCFDDLNIPTDHPARQMQDTFYMHGHSGDAGSLVLRTHTSPVQVRTMLSQAPPIRIICPGRTFRSDYDATHTPMFHQIEGLVIDETAHMGHLKGVLMDFLAAYFEVDAVKIQLRPSYFPFTEPSAEVDIGYENVGGELKIGQGDKWMEILGCGMVNSRVLENCGIDSSKYQGFAFGMGVERLSMLKYGMPDLRPYFDSDVRWLKHYAFDPLLIPSMVRGLHA